MKCINDNNIFTYDLIKEEKTELEISNNSQYINKLSSEEISNGNQKTNNFIFI